MTGRNGAQPQPLLLKEAIASPGFRRLSEEKSWLETRRRRAYEALKVSGFPGRRQEAWKYIDLNPILNTAYSSAEHLSADALREAAVDRFFAGREGEDRVVFVNGVFAPSRSVLRALPQGTLVQTFTEALSKNPGLLKKYLAEHSRETANGFEAVNTMRFSEGLLLYVPKNAEMKEPLRIYSVSCADPSAPVLFFPRILVAADEASRAEILLDHVALGEGPYLSDGVAEVYAEAGAQVRYFHVQRGNGSGNVLMSHHFSLGRDAHVEALSLVRKGSATRFETRVDLKEPGAYVSLKGLAILRERSQAFDHVTVFHKAPHCTSRQYYKSILAGQANDEFNSLVSVSEGAEKSDSRQLHRSLLLSDTAQNHSRPQLQIGTDDVNCSHGSTAGRLEEKEELFYLRSRGFSKALAAFVLTYGFADEILQEISDRRLREETERSVKEEIRTMLALKGEFPC